MPSAFASEPGAGLAADELPVYTSMLAAYHRARAAELRAIIATLPLAPGGRVLDVASGDGCYSCWLAERAAEVVCVDLAPAYLDYARRHAAGTPHAGKIRFVQGDAASLPFADGVFELGWCAQSFYSLSDPPAVVREMIRVTRPGGHVAVLENDTLHQIVLPWPAELELAVRQAQLRALEIDQAGQGVDRFYIGRNLCRLLRQCGLEMCAVRLVPVERDAPLGADEELFLQLYFADLRRVAWPYLEATARAAFDTFFDPHSATYLLRRPDFHMTHLEALAIGRRPDAIRAADLQD
jgi:SAM-dependent methyltransferase